MKAIVVDKNNIGYYLEDTFIDDDATRHRIWGRDMLEAMMFDTEEEAQSIIDAFLSPMDAYVIDVLESN